MKFINRGRGTGKSLMLLNTAHVTGHPIIVSTCRQKDYLSSMANELGLSVEIYTVTEWSKVSRHYEEILIDEAESIIEDALKYYLQSDVLAATITFPMDTLKEKKCNKEDTSSTNTWCENSVKPDTMKWCIVKDKNGKEYKFHQWNGYCWYYYIIDEDGYDRFRSDVDVKEWRYDEEMNKDDNEQTDN